MLHYWYQYSHIKRWVILCLPPTFKLVFVLTPNFFTKSVLHARFYVIFQRISHGPISCHNYKFWNIPLEYYVGVKWGAIANTGQLRQICEIKNHVLFVLFLYYYSVLPLRLHFYVICSDFQTKIICDLLSSLLK